MPPGSPEPVVVTLAIGDGSSLALQDVVLSDGQPVVFYTVESWSVDEEIDNPGTTVLYSKNLVTNEEVAWREVGGLDWGSSWMSFGGELVAFDVWAGSIRGLDVRTFDSWDLADADPDGEGRTEGICAQFCAPSLNSDGSMLGYVEAEQTAVVLDAITGATVIEMASAWLDDVGTKGGPRRTAEGLTVLDFESGTGSLIPGLGAEARSAVFVPGGLDLDLPRSLRTPDLESPVLAP